MPKQSSVLVYGTNLGGYRAAYALCKKGHKVLYLNRGSYVDEIRNQALSQLPLDFCWMCGHFPQRLFKGLGCLQDFYNAELQEVSGQAGDFKVKFKTKPQTVNNFICTECDKCIEVCPVQVKDGRKAIFVHPEIGWENIYLIDWEHCTQCLKCEEVCPTGAIKLEQPEEIKQEEVAAVILALEYEDPLPEELNKFGFGASPAVVKNSELARQSLLTNFVKDSVKLPSGKTPQSFAVVVTPHFNNPGTEYESYNLCVSAAYRSVKLKEILPESDVTIFLKDYRGIGKRHHRWYQKALDAGVEIEKAEELNILPGKKEDVLVHYRKNGTPLEKSVELAILVNGQKPPHLMGDMSRICRVNADDAGFCRIRPFSCCETDVDGIFAVGEFSGPKGNPEAIWEGCASLTEIVKYLGESNFKPAPPPTLRNVSGEELRIGVFICSCFGTFEEKMDLTALREAVAELPDVAHAEVIKGCCTPPSMQETAEIIKRSGVNRVVLAVCTPIQKLLKYRKTVMMAGLNPLLTEFLRLREDVIHVHRDREKMHAKALTLIKAAAAKVRKGIQAPTLKDSFTPQALVIGAGISGLTSAAHIADNGFPVTLVEKGEALGGGGDSFNKQQKEHLEELIAKIEDHPNITIHKNTELIKMSGYAGNFSGKIDTLGKKTPVKTGVVILATGAHEYKPDGFLYGQDPRILTQTELQNTVNGHRTGIRTVMIQCIGSRIQEHPYCSRVCCHQALNNAISLREKGAEVTILYRDMTNYGQSDMYQQARDLGVKFIRFPDSAYPEVKKNGEVLQVTLPDEGEMEADLVVLSTGIEPDAENNRNLSRVLGLPLDQDGFFDCDVNVYPYEESIKRLVKPYEWATNCIYPVGLAHSPRSFEESILTAKDAAARAIILLGKKMLPSPNAMYVAGVKEALCMGCGICVDVCPYSARVIDERKKIAVVRPFLCDSCGSCVSVCPNDASYLRDLMSNQTISSLDALLFA
jgi:heterodisulfide reductase subunit A